MSGSDPRVGERLGRYRLLEVLGRGGMGSVFRARDDELERDVAIKVILPAYAEDPEFRERFRREAVVLSQMNSPHVVAVYDHGESDGAPYLVTQLVGGGDLFSMLTAGGVVEPGRAIDLAAQVLQGLADAHAIGVVHRDIKPSNVLLGDAGQAVLCDFGIASSPGSDLTRTGTMIGSTGYMAPERHSAGAVDEVGVAADVYAVGCLVWAMLAGSQPFVGSDAEVAMGHLHGPVPQFPGSSPFLDQINQVLMRSLAKDPGRRYPSARAMLAELEKARPLAAAGVVVPDVTAVRQSLELPKPQAPTQHSRRRRAVAALLMAALLLVGVYVGSLLDGVEVVQSALTSDDPAESAPAAGQPSDGASLPIAGPGGSDAESFEDSTIPPGDVGEKGAREPRTGQSNSPKRSPRSQPKAPTKAPISKPQPTITCWNGGTAKSLDDCGWPTGASGYKWVFPGSNRLNCQPLGKSTAGYIQGWECRTKLANGTYKLISFQQWRSVAQAVAYNRDRYKEKWSDTAWEVGGTRYGWGLTGKYQNDYAHILRIYDAGDTHWAVTAGAKKYPDRDSMIDKVSFRPPSELRGIRR